MYQIVSKVSSFLQVKNTPMRFSNKRTFSRQHDAAAGYWLTSNTFWNATQNKTKHYILIYYLIDICLDNNHVKDHIIGVWVRFVLAMLGRLFVRLLSISLLCYFVVCLVQISFDTNTRMHIHTNTYFKHIDR